MKKILILSILLFPFILFANDMENAYLSKFSTLEKDGSVQLVNGANIPADIEQNQLNSTAFYDKIGKSISIPPITEANVEAVCKNFIKKYRADIDTANLKLLSANYRRNQWYIDFVQTYNGIQLLNSNVKMRLFKNGNLMSIDTKYYGDVSISNIGSVDTNAMKAYAVAGVSINDTYNTSNISFTFGEQFILPIIIDDRYVYKFVQQLEFRNKLGDVYYGCYIDVNTNELLLRYNLVHNYDYQVKSKIVEVEPNKPLVETTYFPYILVSDIEGKVGPNRSRIANANGLITTDYDLNGYTASIKFRSGIADSIPIPFKVKFYNFDGTDELKEFELSNLRKVANNTISNNDNVLLNRIVATHYHSFYKMYDKFKKIDDMYFDYYFNKNYTISYIICQNDGDMQPNASAAGYQITMYNPLHSKYRLGQMPSVLYHELGHSINNYMYQGRGWMQNTALHEGTADVHSAIMLGYSDVFRGLSPNYKPAPQIDRFLENNLRMGYDDMGEPHYDGQILSGAIWDFAMYTGDIDLMAELFHFTRYATPDADVKETGKAFTKWFIEMLLTDDDDGDLSNLTPHWEELVTAFDRHNIGFDAFMRFNLVHFPLKDTSYLGPYKIVFSIPRINTFRAVDDVWLHYSTNDGQYDSMKMIRDGDVYTSYIPEQKRGDVVKYHFRVNSPFSHKYFALAPYDTIYMFRVDFKEIYSDYKSSARDIKSTSANSVKWVYVNLASISQVFSPKKDHNGDEYAWQLRSGISSYESIRLNYADLTYPKFDVSNKYKVWVELYYWLYNSYGGEDMTSGLIFQISKDGGQSWIDVAKESSYEDPGTKEWQYLSFIVNDYFDTFSNFMLRIRAVGESNQYAKYAQYASYIDGVRVLVDGGVSIEDEEVINTIIYPNPTTYTASVTLDLPQATLLNIALYDVWGGYVKQIYNAFTDAGTFTQPFTTQGLTKGTYYLNIKFGDIVKVEKVVVN